MHASYGPDGFAPRVAVRGTRPAQRRIRVGCTPSVWVAPRWAVPGQLGWHAAFAMAQTAYEYKMTDRHPVHRCLGREQQRWASPSDAPGSGPLRAMRPAVCARHAALTLPVCEHGADGGGASTCVRTPAQQPLLQIPVLYRRIGP